MKQNIINSLVIVAVLVITGMVRMPIEKRLTDELLEKKLIPERVSLENRIALKQKGFTSGFGSLRPTVAAFMSFAASNSHSDQDWEKLEKQYKDILLLDPRNPYYWDMASWHMISNAAGYYKYHQEIPYLTRHKLFHEYVDKGEEILRKGKEINPENWKIHLLEPKHYGSRYRRPDYEKAAEGYKHLIHMKGVPTPNKGYYQRARLYCLNKIPERHQEAYDLALQLYQNPNYRLPSLRISLWAGQNHPLNKVSNPMSLLDIFGSYLSAYHNLRNGWKVKKDREDKYGMEEALRMLEKELFIPNHKRVFPIKPLFMQ